MLLPTENIGEGSFSQSRDPEDKCKKRPAGRSGRKLKQQWHVCIFDVSGQTILECFFLLHHFFFDYKNRGQ